MKSITAFTLVLFLTLPPAGAQQKAKSSAVLMDTVEKELKRAMDNLSKRDPAPYFISYSVTDDYEWFLSAMQGAMLNNVNQHVRSVDISVRIASPELDNTHNEGSGSGVHSVYLPLEDDPEAIARVLWEATDQEYKTASRMYLQMKTNTAVRAKEEDTSADFTKEDPQVHMANPPAVVAPDVAAWEKKVKQYSAILGKFPNIYDASVLFSAS